jgi:hypothetical protein
LSLPNLGSTIDAVTKRGASFAVCDTATYVFSTQTAAALGCGTDAMYKDPSPSLIPDSRLVSAASRAVTGPRNIVSQLYAG